MQAWRISLAAEADAPEILAMQRLAWEPEARLYQDWSLPPLTQTLDELRADIGEMTFLKASTDDRIVGSVRARQQARPAWSVGSWFTRTGSGKASAAA